MLDLCEPVFNEPPQPVPDPVIFVVQHDYKKTVNLPEFTLENANCEYTIQLDAFLWSDGVTTDYEGQLGTVRDPLPKFINFF